MTLNRAEDYRPSIVRRFEGQPDFVEITVTVARETACRISVLAGRFDFSFEALAAFGLDLVARDGDALIATENARAAAGQSHVRRAGEGAGP